jgi:hypothetical protein
MVFIIFASSLVFPVSGGVRGVPGSADKSCGIVRANLSKSLLTTVPTTYQVMGTLMYQDSGETCGQASTHDGEHRLNTLPARANLSFGNAWR